MSVASDEIIIHVCDDVKKVERDFVCKRDVLVKEMLYFATYVADGRSTLDDIDISVHCDVTIFEWLMEYVHHPDNPPSLSPGSVVSILISAEFLRMDGLQTRCLQYIHEHLNDILKLPIDMDCISDALLSRLSEMFSPDDLDKVKDRRDRFLGRLYLKKLEALLRDPEVMLHSCALCKALFTSSQREWMICSKAKVFIDFHGTPIAQHVVDRAWDVNKFLISLRQNKKYSWREVYWKIWGLTHSFSCTRCARQFLAAELTHCSYHSQDPQFEPGSNSGT